MAGTSARSAITSGAWRVAPSMRGMGRSISVRAAVRAVDCLSPHWDQQALHHGAPSFVVFDKAAALLRFRMPNAACPQSRPGKRTQYTRRRAGYSCKSEECRRGLFACLGRACLKRSQSDPGCWRPGDVYTSLCASGGRRCGRRRLDHQCAECPRR